MMPPDLGAALQHNLGAGGVLPALPLDVADLHAEQRGATHSVRRKRARSFMETERGLAWAAERRRLHRADDPGDAEDAEDPE